MKMLGKNKTPYRWILAYAYFSVVILISWGCGVLQLICQHPLGSPVEVLGTSSPAFGLWLIATLFLFAYAIIGYWVIWTGWTKNYGRPFSWFSLFLMGIPWGLEEGMTWLIFWQIIRSALNSIWGTVTIFSSYIVDVGESNGFLYKLLLLIGIIGLESVYGRFYHEKFWDIYISPSHNIRETNNRKVLLLHIPISTLIYIYLVWYESLAMVLVFSCMVFMGSVFGMRFPPPWYPTTWPTPDPTGYSTSVKPVV